MPRWMGCLACLALVGCPKPDHIELEPQQLTFARRGEQVWVHAKFLDHTSRVYLRQPATWSSSDPKVATVDSAEKPGNVTATGPGHCTITIKGDDGIEAELPVAVNTVEKIQVAPAEVKLSEDGEKQPITVTALDLGGHPLKGRTAHLKCQDEKVCNSDGDNVWPVGAGTTVLEVELDDQSAKVPVTVEKAKGKK